MSRIVLAKMNAEARYWTLRGLQYWLATDETAPVEYSTPEIQSLATTMKIREVKQNKSYPDRRRTRTVTITGSLKGESFELVCEQQFMRTDSRFDPECFIVRVSGSIGRKPIGFLAHRFKDEGLPQPPKSH